MALYVYGNQKYLLRGRPGNNYFLGIYTTLYLPIYYVKFVPI